MTKNSTSSYFIEKEKNRKETESLNTEFSDIQNALDKVEIEAPQKSVDFILNFSKVYKTDKLSNGEYTDVVTN
jgi:hypothetical protein